MLQISKLWRKYSYTVLIGFIVLGMFDLRISLAALICMLAPVALSFKRGRFWCGNLCPRGNFYDRIMIRFKGKRKVPAFMRSTPFRASVVILMLSTFVLGMIRNWGDLYGMGMVLYRLIVVTTIIGVILVPFFSHRTWCSFCPMGSLAALVSHFKNRKNSENLLKVNSTCVSCRLCKRKCPMDIAPYEYQNDAITHHDCIQCSTCVYTCPKKAISYDEPADIKRSTNKKETVA